MSTGNGGSPASGGVSGATGGTGGAANAGSGGSMASGGATGSGGSGPGDGGTMNAPDSGPDASASGGAAPADASAGGTGGAELDATASGGAAANDASAGGAGGAGTGGTADSGIPDASSTADASAGDASAPTPDAAEIDGSGDSDAPTPVWFPGSVLVDAGQGVMINGWVGTPTQLWRLCYSTELHALSGATFHENCDFEGASVSIARVSYDTETRVIGGYNSSSWYSPATAGYSNNVGSFLFSVTNSFKHEFPGAYSGPWRIFNNALYGPTFGAGADWYVHSQMLFGTCRPGYSYQCRVGTLDSTECNVDFCGTPSGSDYYDLDVLEVWVH